MKMSLNWHKECLGNMRQSLDYEDKQMMRAIANWKRLKDQIDFYELQIATAEKEGKDGFDDEKYLIKRKQKI